MPTPGLFRPLKYHGNNTATTRRKTPNIGFVWSDLAWPNPNFLSNFQARRLANPMFFICSVGIRLPVRIGLSSAQNGFAWVRSGSAIFSAEPTRAKKFPPTMGRERVIKARRRVQTRKIFAGRGGTRARKPKESASAARPLIAGPPMICPSGTGLSAAISAELIAFSKAPATASATSLLPPGG